MKRNVLFAAALLGLLPGTLWAQSLADLARAQQKNKRTQSATGKVYTNDSLGFHPGSDASAKSDDSKKSDAKADSKSDKKADAGSEDDKKKAAEELKAKVDKQKSEIAQLQRELEIAQRENKLRSATYYADAGNRLRDEKKYADDDRKYQAEIAGKQKAIADAQAELDKLREEARRTGVPVS